MILCSGGVFQKTKHKIIGYTNQTITITLKFIDLLHIGNLSEKRLLKAATIPCLRTEDLLLSSFAQHHSTIIGPMLEEH